MPLLLAHTGVSAEVHLRHKIQFLIFLSGEWKGTEALQRYWALSAKYFEKLEVSYEVISVNDSEHNISPLASFLKCQISDSQLSKQDVGIVGGTVTEAVGKRSGKSHNAPLHIIAKWQLEGITDMSQMHTEICTNNLF